MGTEVGEGGEKWREACRKTLLLQLRAVTCIMTRQLHDRLCEKLPYRKHAQGGRNRERERERESGVCVCVCVCCVCVCVCVGVCVCVCVCV